MRGLGKFLGVLATIMLLVIGGALIANSFGLFNISELLFGRDTLMRLVGAGMVLFGIVVIFAAVQSVRPEHAISIQNPEGEVRIALNAIEELISKAILKIDGVKEFNPKVVGGKRGIEVMSHATVEANVNIPQVTMKIQEMVKAQVKGILGIDEVGPIRTYVNKIVSDETGLSEEKKIV